MNKTRVTVLVLTFILAMVYQPKWVYENFWSKADFYDSIPFTVPYFIFLLIYAETTTGCAELGFSFFKKNTGVDFYYIKL